MPTNGISIKATKQLEKDYSTLTSNLTDGTTLTKL